MNWELFFQILRIKKIRSLNCDEKFCVLMSVGGHKNKTPRITSEGFILKRMENTYFLLAVFFLAVFFFLVAMNVLLSRE
jgi:hypothetical protein